MLPRPSQECRQSGRRFSWNFRGKHGDETTKPTQFGEFGENRAQSSGTAILSMLDARGQFAATTFLLDPPLLCFTPEPPFRLRRCKYREADSDVAGHILQPLNLGIVKAAARRRAPENIDLLELKRELAGRMVVPFRKAGPVEEYVVSGVPPRRAIPLSFPGLLLGLLGIS